MNRFGNHKNNSSFIRHIFSSVIILILSIGILLTGVSSVSDNARQSYAESLQLALQRSAVHCYAVEGSYPESLDYLKEHYAVSWDPDRYVVDYEIAGANRMPVITVIALKHSFPAFFSER